MKPSTTLMLTATLVALQIPSILCSSWWSIVGRPNVFNPSDKKAPIHLQCSGFSSILKEKQLELCKKHDKLLSTTAIGTLGALNECQKLFKDRAWNCSVFDSSTHYLGRFIENCTRETAFLDSITSAGIAREVARKCKEQELTACGCDFSVTGKIMDSSTVIGGCGDNVKFGTEIARQFTDPCPDNLTDCCNLTIKHNNNVGRKLVESSTTVACICHGVSGSCSVQTCFKKVPDIQELGMKVLQKYDVAKHVKAENGKLVPFDSTTPPLQEDELAYCEFSPNFCKRDLRKGIYGTSGRRCYPNRNDHTSCASLCCGGAAEQRVVKIKEDEDKCCKFVWCCYLDCSKCTTYRETQYFCK